MSGASEAREKLLPCPFCGGGPKEIEFFDYDLSRAHRLGVKCETCDVGIEGAREDREVTVLHWNTRALTSAGTGEGWETIEHPYKPETADAERQYLKDKLKSFPEAAVMTLTTYALTQPPQGSFAGSLWALAEYVKTLLAAAPSPSRREPTRVECAEAAFNSLKDHHLLCAKTAAKAVRSLPTSKVSEK